MKNITCYLFIVLLAAQLGCTGDNPEISGPGNNVDANYREDDTRDIPQAVLNEGQIFLTADPGVLWTGAPGICDTTAISCVLLGAYGDPISNRVIDFYVSYPWGVEYHDSGITDSDGYCLTSFRVCYEQIPTDPDGPPHTLIVTISANLDGYPDIGNEFDIICNRP